MLVGLARSIHQLFRTVQPLTCDLNKCVCYILVQFLRVRSRVVGVDHSNQVRGNGQMAFTKQDKRSLRVHGSESRQEVRVLVCCPVQ